jgi:type III secretion system YopN/LcrE/InvE/MxiC family regulator
MLGPLSLAGRDAAESIRQASFSASSAGAPGISLTNAAEEMAQFFSQARLQERSLKERHLATYESPALRRVEEVEALLQVIWADPKNKGNGDAQQLASQLLAFAGNPEALDRTLKQVNGSTEQFLLLSKALAQGATQGNGNPVLESLRDRVDALWARDGVRIRADVNIAPQLASAEDKGAKDRQAYHDAVLDGDTLPRTLMLLLARYGDGIEAAVERLRQALGADLVAARPSLPIERLRAILHELFMLGALLPFLMNCRDLGRRARLHKRKNLGSKAEDDAEADEGAALLGELAEWVPRWLTQGDVRSLLYQYGLSLDQQADSQGGGPTSPPADGKAAAMSESDRLLVVLHGIRSILRQVPERLFPDGEHKLNADQVLVGVLDNLILGEADEPPRPQN